MKPLTELEKEFFKAMNYRKYVEGRDGYSWAETDAKAAATLCERKMIDLVGWITRQDSKTLLLRTDLLIKKYLSEEKLSEPQK